MFNWSSIYLLSIVLKMLIFIGQIDANSIFWKCNEWKLNYNSTTENEHVKFAKDSLNTGILQLGIYFNVYLIEKHVCSSLFSNRSIKSVFCPYPLEKTLLPQPHCIIQLGLSWVTKNNQCKQYSTLILRVIALWKNYKLFNTIGIHWRL